MQLNIKTKNFASLVWIAKFGFIKTGIIMDFVGLIPTNDILTKGHSSNTFTTEF